MKPLPKLTLPNAAAWSNWLAEHGTTSPGVALTLAKKGTSDPTSLNQNEAVEEALCHGWINGQGHTIDRATYMQRFTPRARKSVWSKRNVGLVEALEREGRMREAGRAAVEAAKEDGRWERAYSGAANLDEMRDLVDAVEADPAASTAWDRLNQGHRSQIYFRLAALKTEAGRKKNIREFVEKLAGVETSASSTAAPSVASKTRKRGVSECDEGEMKEERTQIRQAKKTRSGRLSRPPVP